MNDNGKAYVVLPFPNKGAALLALDEYIEFSGRVHETGDAMEYAFITNKDKD